MGEVKGSECLEQFAKLQICMKDFPELYEEKNKDGGETESGDVSKKEEEESTKDSPSSTDSQPAKEEVMRWRRLRRTQRRSPVWCWPTPRRRQLRDSTKYLIISSVSRPSVAFHHIFSHQGTKL